MKNRYFANRDEIEYFMLNLWEGNKFTNNNFEFLNNAVESSYDWETEVVSNNYFYSKSIDRLDKRPDFQTLEAIEQYYKLPDCMSFSIEECSEAFIEGLMSHLPNQKVSLDENLINYIKSNPNV